MKANEGYRDPVELEADDLDTVLLERTTDPMRASMLRTLLEDEGIAVSTPGYNVSAMTGAMGVFDISVRVPRIDFDRARDALAARGALSSKITVETPRRWRVAFMVALVPGFGAGHVYCGAYLSGALLGAAQLVAMTAAMGGRVPLAILALLFAKVADIWGSRAAADRANRKEPVRGWLSSGAIVGTALVPIYLFVMSSYGPAWLAGDEARIMCEFNARCFEADETACLLTNVNASLDGWNGYSPACVRCVDEEHTCSEVAAECAEVCGF